MKKLDSKVKEFIKEKSKKLRNAKDIEEEKLHFYGSTQVIFFLFLNDMISSELYNECDDMIDKAREEYYEKAKKQFEEAHKKLF